MRRVLLALAYPLALACLPGAALAQGPLVQGRLAQGRAEGAYPAVLFCEAGAGGGAVRASFTLEIADGRARYAVTTPGGPETGTGVLTGRSLVLAGKGRGYDARYAGTVDGQGGLLTGRRNGPGAGRACQVSLGNGRG